MNIAAISTFTDAVRAEGAAMLDLTATGTADMPSVTGFVELADASISVEEPEIAVEALEARIDLAGQRATLSRLEGRVNGGALSGGGSDGDGLRTRACCGPHTAASGRRPRHADGSPQPEQRRHPGNHQ